MVASLDANDPQPLRNEERFGGDYAAFRRADKAWNERERKRRKLLQAPSAAPTAPGEIAASSAVVAPDARAAELPGRIEGEAVAAPKEAARAVPLHPKPRGRVPLGADGDPCVWDGKYGRWLDQAGREHFVDREAQRRAFFSERKADAAAEKARCARVHDDLLWACIDIDTAVCQQLCEEGVSVQGLDARSGVERGRLPLPLQTDAMPPELYDNEKNLGPEAFHVESKKYGSLKHRFSNAEQEDILEALARECGISWRKDSYYVRSVRCHRCEIAHHRSERYWGAVQAILTQPLPPSFEEIRTQAAQFPSVESFKAYLPEACSMILRMRMEFAREDACVHAEEVETRRREEVRKWEASIEADRERSREAQREHFLELQKRSIAREAEPGSCVVASSLSVAMEQHPGWRHCTRCLGFADTAVPREYWGSEPRVRLHLEIFRTATGLPEGDKAPVVLMAGAWERWWEKRKGVELARGQCGKCLWVNPRVAAAPPSPPPRPGPLQRLYLSSFK